MNKISKFKQAINKDNYYYNYVIVSSCLHNSKANIINSIKSNVAVVIITIIAIVVIVIIIEFANITNQEELKRSLIFLC